MNRERSTLTTLALLGAGLLLPMVAARASRKVVGAGYRLVTDEEPPQNPASPEVDWQDALVWTIITGAIGGIARLAVRRTLAPSRIPAEGYDFEAEAQEIGEG